MFTTLFIYYTKFNVVPVGKASASTVDPVLTFAVVTDEFKKALSSIVQTVGKFNVVGKLVHAAKQLFLKCVI